MTTSSSAPDPTWEHASPAGISQVLGATPARWWLSGGVALDHWLGRAIRARENADISTLRGDLIPLIESLPPHYSAWAPSELEDGGTIPIGEVADPLPLDRVLVKNEPSGCWTVQVHVEDGGNSGWQYRRDGRLQLPWEKAVLDIEGIPTGAPEVQLVWKALRPRPEDDLDKDAVLPELSTDATAWFEHAILSIHPHSSWSIHVRSPFAPAKASWNRGR